MLLELYTSQECSSCDRAEFVAHMLAARFPEVELRVVDVDVPGVELAEVVFAVPTFVLDGQVISLGTPDPTEVAKTIRTALGMC